MTIGVLNQLEEQVSLSQHKLFTLISASRMSSLSFSVSCVCCRCSQRHRWNGRSRCCGRARSRIRRVSLP
jgi:hypothetical protein